VVQADAHTPSAWRPLNPLERAEFDKGYAVFNTEWVPANSPPGRIDGLGPVFNLQSCDACHNSRRRGGGSPSSGDVPADLVIQLGRQQQGRLTRGSVNYGYVLNPSAIARIKPEGRIIVSYHLLHRTLPDGSSVELREPHYRVIELSGPPLGPDTVLMPRLPPAVQGVGLLEKVPSRELERIARDEARNYGTVHGRISRVSGRGREPVGRFGWQATEPTVASQIATAFSREMGLTTDLIGSDDCGTSTECRAAPAGGSPEVEPELFDAVVTFEQLHAVPVLHALDESELGARLFIKVGCSDCHRVSVRADTGSAQPTEIHPFTDLLVHSMGEGLADRDLQGRPAESLWRTAPLWGMEAAYSSGRPVLLLHDGRARTLEEAILWHDGEASRARDRFCELSRDARLALVEWIRSL
jgi:CxxC motif-containing protein (DUF1111 family)